MTTDPADDVLPPPAKSVSDGRRRARRSDRAFVPRLSGLESRELLAHVPFARAHAAPAVQALRDRRRAPSAPATISPPTAPPGDFGSVQRPTLVVHPDRPETPNPLWQYSREYSYGSSPRNRFHLIIQPGGSDKLAFFIHGGGFTAGTATGSYNYPVLEKLWNEGYSIASIEYPLLKESAWPGPVWATANGIIAANRLAGAGISHRIIVGESAGATAGALALYSPDPRSPSLPFRVDAFVGASGIYVSPWYRPPAGGGNKSGFNLFGEVQKAFKGGPKTATPAFLIAGDHDVIDHGAGTKDSDVRRFADYLTRGGAPVVTVVTSGVDGSHLAPFWDLKNPQIGGFYDLALRYGLSTLRRR